MAEPWPIDGLEPVGSCPSCGAPERATLYTNLEDRVFSSALGRWTLQRCGGCGAAYLDPRPTRETIGLAYRRYYTHAADAIAEPSGAPLLAFRRALANGYLNARYGYAFTPGPRIGVLTAAILPKRRLTAEMTVRHLSLRPGGRLLDVGCGNGSFLSRMREAGWEVQGIEPDPEAASVARASGVPVVEGSLTEATFSAASFDAVTLNHVVEHLHDPGETLGICRTILRPGGTLWIATPNLEGAGHRRFGRDWLHLDPPRHLVLFTRSALVRLVRSKGFERLSFRAPRSAPEAFAFSAALAAGLDPQGELPLSRSLLLRARLADLVTGWRPRNAEELVLLAEAPW